MEIIHAKFSMNRTTNAFSFCVKSHPKLPTRRCKQETAHFYLTIQHSVGTSLTIPGLNTVADRNRFCWRQERLTSSRRRRRQSQERAGSQKKLSGSRTPFRRRQDIVHAGCRDLKTKLNSTHFDANSTDSNSNSRCITVCNAPWGNNKIRGNK